MALYKSVYYYYFLAHQHKACIIIITGLPFGRDCAVLNSVMKVSQI